MESKKHNQYTEEFKKSIVTLHQNGKSKSQLHREYGISFTAIKNWIKQYSEVKIDSDSVLTAKQVRNFKSAMLSLKRRISY